MAPIVPTSPYLFAFHAPLDFARVDFAESEPTEAFRVPVTPGGATAGTTSPAFKTACKAIEHAAAMQDKQEDVIDKYSRCIIGVLVVANLSFDAHPGLAVLRNRRISGSSIIQS